MSEQFHIVPSGNVPHPPYGAPGYPSSEMRLACETCGNTVRFAIDIEGPITVPVVTHVSEAIEVEPVANCRRYVPGRRYMVTIEPVE